MTKEEMKKEMERIEKQQQLDFINKLYDMVEHYTSKRGKTSYIVSPEEHLKFEKIYHMIIYISEKL